MEQSMISAYAGALEVLSEKNAKVIKADSMDFAVKLAKEGYTSFVNSPFLFGTEDVFVRMHSCCTHNTNIKLSVYPTGCLMEKGAGIPFNTEDIALMRGFPNLMIFVPCDGIEARKAVMAAALVEGPVYIRLSGKECETVTSENTPFVPGKGNVIKEGMDVCILANGLMVSVALKAAKIMEDEGISTAVVNMHTIKPIDEDIILQMNDNCDVIVTLEEHSLYGGLGTSVAEILAGHDGAGFARIGMEGSIVSFARTGDPGQTQVLTPEYVVKIAKSLL